MTRRTGGCAGLAAIAALSAGAAMAQPKERTAPEPKNLALVGVTQIGDRVEAWLVNLDTRAKATLKLGETAFGYRLQKVGPEQVTLVRHGKPLVLRLDDRQAPESRVTGYRPETRPDDAAITNPRVTIVERTPAGTTGQPSVQIVNHVVVEPAAPVVTSVPEAAEDLRSGGPYPLAPDPYLRSGYAPFYVPDYLGAPRYYPPWASQYPVITKHRYPYAPYTPYWPKDLHFAPLLRLNPQTFRRRSREFFGDPFSANPQTRRRTAIQQFGPIPWGPYYPPPVFPYGFPYGW